MADFDLNATLYPIIAGVVALMPSFLDLILAVVPIVSLVSTLSGGYRHRHVRRRIHHQVLGSHRCDDDLLRGSRALGFPSPPGRNSYKPLDAISH